MKLLEVERKRTPSQLWKGTLAIGRYRGPEWWRGYLVSRAERHLKRVFPFPRLGSVLGVGFSYQAEVRR